MDGRRKNSKLERIGTLNDRPAHQQDHLDYWVALETEEVLQELGTRLPQGLEDSQAARRLPEPSGRPALPSLASLARLVPAALLVGAGGLAWAAGRRGTALTLLGAAAGLARLGREPARPAPPAVALPPGASVRVRRAGVERRVSARDLVRGDLVLLGPGEISPADIRLMETTNLRVDQSHLSGDARPVDKVPQPMRRPGIPPADQQNMLYQGTRLLEGRAAGLVVASGADTLASRLLAGSAAAPAPAGAVSRAARRQALWLAGAGLAAAGIGAALGRPLASLSASLASGSAGVLHLALALERRRSAGRLRAAGAGELVRIDLDALAHSDTLLADLELFTQSDARVLLMDLAGQAVEPGSAGAEAGQPTPAHALLAGAAALCTNATIERAAEWGAPPAASGDPAEAALLRAAAALGLWKPRLEKILPRVLEAPYTPERSRMSTVHVARLTPSLSEPEQALASRFEGHPYLVVTRGSLESILEVCGRAWVDGRVQPLTPQRRLAYQAALAQLTQAGLRISGVAFRPLVTMQPIYKEAWTPYNGLPPEVRRVIHRGPRDIAVSTSAAVELEQDLVLLGWFGTRVEPAPGAAETLRLLDSLGMGLLLTTADGPRDGLHTLRQLGLDPADERVPTGSDLRGLAGGDLRALAGSALLFSRLTAADRVALVRALQRAGQRVAVAGAGPQHAPAAAAAGLGLPVSAGGVLALQAALRESRSSRPAELLQAASRLQWGLLAGSLAASLAGLLVQPALVLAAQLAAALLLARTKALPRRIT